MMQLSQQPAKYHSLIFSITAPVAVAQALQCGSRFFLLCHDSVCWGEQVVGWLHLKQGSQAGEKYQPHKDSGNTHPHSA